MRGPEGGVRGFGSFLAAAMWGRRAFIQTVHKAALNKSAPPGREVAGNQSFRAQKVLFVADYDLFILIFLWRGYEANIIDSLLKIKDVKNPGKRKRDRQKVF